MDTTGSSTGSGRAFWWRVWWVLAVSGAAAAVGLAALMQDPLFLFLPFWGAGTKVIFAWDDTHHARELAETALVWIVVTAWLVWREGDGLWTVPFVSVAFLAVAGGHAAAVLRHMATEDRAGTE